VHYVASKGGVLSLTRNAASCRRPRGSCPAVVWPFAWVSARPPRRSHRASTYEASRQRGANRSPPAPRSWLAALPGDHLSLTRAPGFM